MPTIKELKAELKAKGIKGITGKKKSELMAMLAKGEGGEKKVKSPNVGKLPKMTKEGKKIPKELSMPKQKVSMNLQEELAKAGLRGGMKKKYKV